MTNWLLWLITLELLGLAGLPLAAVLFRAFPDRGYGLSKPLGILLVGFLNFWLGSVGGFANQPVLLWLLAIVVLAGGAFLFLPDLPELLVGRRNLLITVAIEEAVFLVAFGVWTWVRLVNPDIFSTEKPMDFMLLQVSGMTHSFPPPDAWLSGHAVNYYYLGYAIFGMLGRMSGVDPRFGFDLSNITVFALGCVGGYSLTLALSRSRLWGLAGAFALILAGNIDGLSQFVAQIANGGPNGSGLNLWCSTRIIDGGCSNYHTITEIPIFSMLWNDLHPHVMALPFAVLAVGLAVHAMVERDTNAVSRAHWYARLALAAIALGALFPINSWDYPTYLIVAIAAMYLGAHRGGGISARVAAEIGAVVPASLLLYLPYYLTVHNSKGIGLQHADTAINDMLDVVGGLLIPLAVFAIWRLIDTLARSATDPEAEQRFPYGWIRDAAPGAGWWAIGIVVFAVFVFPARTDLLLLLLIVIAGFTMVTRLEEEDGAVLVILGLLIAGSVILFLGDNVYLRDNFDNSPNYRMNTVFKLYYQAWILLAVGAPAAIAMMLRSLGGAWRPFRIAGFAAAAFLAAALAVYPIEGVASQTPSMASNPGLDGLAYVKQVDLPDYQTIVYIRDHLPTDAVIAEADGSALAGNTVFGCSIEYWTCPPPMTFSRISALTGRPTIIGWPGSHEALWHGAYGGGSDAIAAGQMLAQRESDVRTLYTTTDQAQAITILRRYKVSYVYVGPLERTAYTQYLAAPPAALGKFARFLHPVFTTQGAVLYQVPNNVRGG
jgi:YYY domain-containing protein